MTAGELIEKLKTVDPDVDERFEDYDENVTLFCANCRDVGCAGWYVLDPMVDTRLQQFVGSKVAFCSAECVCEYLGIPFYNDDELDKDCSMR